MHPLEVKEMLFTNRIALRIAYELKDRLMIINLKKHRKILFNFLKNGKYKIN